MSENPYTGEVPIVITGKTYTMTLNWGVIAKIQAELGAGALQQIYRNTVEENARIIALACGENGPSLEEVLASQLPIIPTTMLLDKLITFAYWGAEGPPKEAPAGDDPKKK